MIKVTMIKAVTASPDGIKIINYKPDNDYAVPEYIYNYFLRLGAIKTEQVASDNEAAKAKEEAEAQEKLAQEKAEGAEATEKNVLNNVNEVHDKKNKGRGAK